MEFTIRQSNFKYNYEYKIYRLNQLIYNAKINRVIIPQFRKIKLYSIENQEILCIRQKDYLKFLLGHIPIFNLFSFSICPYEFYKDNVKIGYMKMKSNTNRCIEGKVYDKQYQIWEYNGEYVFIYCNDKQVGLIKRKVSKIGDGDEYKVLFNKELEQEIAINFCLLSDIIWHTSDTQIYSQKWEFSQKLKDENLNVEWVPED